MYYTSKAFGSGAYVWYAIEKESRPHYYQIEQSNPELVHRDLRQNIDTDLVENAS